MIAYGQMHPVVTPQDVFLRFISSSIMKLSSCLAKLFAVKQSVNIGSYGIQ